MRLIKNLILGFNQTSTCQAHEIRRTSGGVLLIFLCHTDAKASTCRSGKLARLHSEGEFLAAG